AAAPTRAALRCALLTGLFWSNRRDGECPIHNIISPNECNDRRLRDLVVLRRSGPALSAGDRRRHRGDDAGRVALWLIVVLPLCAGAARPIWCSSRRSSSAL